MDIDSDSELYTPSSSSNTQPSPLSTTNLMTQNRIIFDPGVEFNPFPLENYTSTKEFSSLDEVAQLQMDRDDCLSLGESNAFGNEILPPILGGTWVHSYPTYVVTQTSDHNASNEVDPNSLNVLHENMPTIQADQDTHVENETANVTHDSPHQSLSDASMESASSTPQTASSPISSTYSDNTAFFDGPYDVERHNLNVNELFYLLRDRYPKRSDENEPPILNKDSLSMDNSASCASGSGQTTNICIDDLDDGRCDIQGISWVDLGFTKHQARYLRKRTYYHHANVLSHRLLASKSHYFQLRPGVAAQVKTLPKFANHLRFSQFSRNFKTRQIHFQLRHMISASSKNAVFLACGDRVQCADPQMNHQKCVMDISKPSSDEENCLIQTISTLTASNTLLVVGGYEGQYAFKSLSVEAESPYTPGTITRDPNGSTNHVHTFLNRRSGLPQAVFANNDRHVRVLDCHTNRFVGIHDMEWAVNCSATSPDTRLRLIIGDSCSPLIVDAEKGTRIATLPNHLDFGFACAWSQNGFHMATGNQDEIIQIWDARKWNKPIHILSADMAGVRTLEFSPLGSGKPVLALAEPADFISIVDAESFHERQRFSFFGEIGGISFTPDGSKFFVANTDVQYGGLFEFDRLKDSRQFIERDGRRRDGNRMCSQLLCMSEGQNAQNFHNDADSLYSHMGVQEVKELDGFDKKHIVSKRVCVEPGDYYRGLDSNELIF